MERLVWIQKWTLRVGLFMLPLAYLPTTYDRWVLPKLLLGRLLVIALAVLYALRVIKEGRIAVKRTPVDLPLLALVASAAISTALSVNVNVSIFGTYSRYDGLLTLAMYAALFWLAVQTLDGPADARALLRALLASAYVVSAVAIGQSITDSLSPASALLGGTDAVQGSIVRAYGSLGQWEVLGEFLVLAWPLALWEAAVARSLPARILFINAAVVLGAAVVLTFSRSTWAAVGIATAVLVAGWRPWAQRRYLIGFIGAVAAVLLLAAGLGLAGGSRFESAVQQRAATILNPAEWDTRPLIWRDSLRLIESRPLLGYGPDTFGLVFPGFKTVDYHLAVDKAHAEVLQLAATQGLVGVAAYLWLLVAFLRAFRTGSREPGAFAVLAGLVGYQAMLQVNFTALGSALPFWIFAAAAMHSWSAVEDRPARTVTRGGKAALRVGIATLAAITVIAVAIPYFADTYLLAAFVADRSGQPAEARSSAAIAARLDPRQSVYAVEVANIAFENRDWNAARDAYTVATDLGTYDAFVYRNLAISDRELGLMSEARAAARAAYELDRFDPINQALLAQFGMARNLHGPASDSRA